MLTAKVKITKFMVQKGNKGIQIKIWKVKTEQKVYRILE
jgi:hypothetical protein